MKSMITKNSYNIRRFKRSCGLVLIAVMWMIVLMTIIATVLARTSRIDTRISLAVAEKVRCKWACRGGIETAIAVLNDDDKMSDTLDDLWSDNPEDFNDIQLDRCDFSVEVIDESSKLNINIATKNQLLYLPDMTEDAADSILDWRDTNDTERTYGAETPYYLNLPNDYPARNKPFRSIRELLLVRSVTEGLFYGDHSDPDVSLENEGWINYLTCASVEKNVNANGEKRVNINKASENQLRSKLGLRKSYAKWIVENRGKKGFKGLANLIVKDSALEPKKSTEKSDKAAALDVQTILGIADNISIVDDDIVPGKVNINTAGSDVIIALLEGDIQVASDIIDYRKTLYGFSSIADLSSVESLTKNNVRKLIDCITTRSNVYTIRSFASAHTTSARRHVEVIVNREKSPVEIIYWNTGARF